MSDNKCYKEETEHLFLIFKTDTHRGKKTYLENINTHLLQVCSLVQSYVQDIMLFSFTMCKSNNILKEIQRVQVKITMTDKHTT